MSNATTLIGFLQKTGAKIRIYEMGRRVLKLSSSDFLKFEQTQISYPYPLQHQAWFGISILDNAVSEEPVIWFLRLPLDEQGKLVQASRDYFIHRLAETALARQQHRNEDTDAFKDNPYIFKPREERMAVFHAKLARDLMREKSKYHDHALDYFRGTPGWDQWSFVGYQGIADIAVEAGDKDVSGILTQAIPLLPPQPLIALCHCLENEPLHQDLGLALFKRLENELSAEHPNTPVVTALIRGLSLVRSTALQKQMVQTVLNGKLATNIEVLAALSGRAWETLKWPEITRQYMHLLAVNDHGQEAFNQCLADLLSIPGMRQPVLATLRDPSRSEPLARAFATMSQALSSID